MEGLLYFYFRFLFLYLFINFSGDLDGYSLSSEDDEVVEYLTKSDSSDSDSDDLMVSQVNILIVSQVNILILSQVNTVVMILSQIVSVMIIIKLKLYNTTYNQCRRNKHTATYQACNFFNFWWISDFFYFLPFL